jgi:glycosyltransferase involved in cell wall biosynthesis
MRILIVHSRYLSGPASGENRVVEDEAKLLGDAGNEVHLWDPQVSATEGWSLVKTGAGAVWSLDAVREARRLIHERRPHVVHFHNLYPSLSPAVLRAGSKQGPAQLMTLHSYRLLCLPATLVRNGRVCEDCLGRPPWPGVLHKCYRGSVAGSGAIASSLILHRWLGSFNRPNLYLAVSRFVKEKHVQAGWAPDRILVKSNFSWPMPRRVGPGDYFLYLGRLAAEKGVGTLLSAWSGMSARLLIVGGGPEEDRLRAMAPSGVEFRDTVASSEVPGLIRGARALVLPSFWYEGQPRSILEAFSAGVPVIASDFGGLPEIVEHEVSGLLVRSRDPAAWRQAAERLLVDSLAEQLGNGAWQSWLRRYTPEHGIRQLMSAYSRALHSR